MTEITRQHLEDAALAAGMEVACTEAALHGTDDTVKIYGGGLMLRGVQDPWRPHLDDGDAFRLAAEMLMYVDHRGTGATARTTPNSLVRVDHDGTPSDAARAAREAVVLCAAEVGRRMREGGA